MAPGNTIADIIGVLERSPAAGSHIGLARELGYSFHDVDAIPDLGDANLDHRSLRLEVRSGLERDGKMSLAGHELRHVWHARQGIIDLLARVPAEEQLAGLWVMEADAVAFQVHVGAEMAQRGNPAIWRRLATREVTGPAAEAYLHAMRRGKSAGYACAKAFESLGMEQRFLDFYEEVARLGHVEQDEVRDPGAFKEMAVRIRASDPTGGRYEARPFREAVSCFRHKATYREPIAAAPQPAP